MNTIKVTNENFEETVRNSRSPVLVDFWADWCGPCKALGPVLEDVASEASDQAVIAKVNIDEEPELASRFQVMSIPTMVIFNNGEEHTRIVGLAPKREILEKLRAN